MNLRQNLGKLSLDLGSVIRPVRIRGIPRVFSWLGPVLFGHGAKCVPSVTGVTLCVDPARYFDTMMVYGRFAPELIALLRKLLKPGDSVIDVGAQLGYVSSNMATLVGPQGRVHSFEPDPNALSMLKRTIDANRHDWIDVFPVALSDASGEMEFHLSPMLGWSTAIHDTHHDDLEAVSVPCKRLDDMVADGDIRLPVRLIKVDVEGYEYAVFDGMQALIEESKPIIVTENAPIMMKPMGLTSADVLQRIVKHGYRVFVLTEPPGLLGGDKYALREIDPTVPQDFCDLVCIPSGEDVPLRSA